MMRIGGVRRVALRGVVAVAGLVLGGCSATGYWHRPGATVYEAKAEIKSCATHFDRPSSPTSVYQPAPIGIGGAVAVGLAAGIAEAIAKSTAFDHCMRQKGYENYAMTDAERARLSAIKDKEERDNLFHELMAKGGENARLGITKAQSTRRLQAESCLTARIPCEGGDGEDDAPVEVAEKQSPRSHKGMADCPVSQYPCQ